MNNTKYHTITKFIVTVQNINSIFVNPNCHLFIIPLCPCKFDFSQRSQPPKQHPIKRNISPERKLGRKNSYHAAGSSQRYSRRLGFENGQNKVSLIHPERIFNDR